MANIENVKPIQPKNAEGEISNYSPWYVFTSTMPFRLRQPTLEEIDGIMKDVQNHEKVIKIITDCVENFGELSGDVLRQTNLLDHLNAIDLLILMYAFFTHVNGEYEEFVTEIENETETYVFKHVRTMDNVEFELIPKAYDAVCSKMKEKTGSGEVVVENPKQFYLEYSEYCIKSLKELEEIYKTEATIKIAKHDIRQITFVLPHGLLDKRYEQISKKRRKVGKEITEIEEQMIKLQYRWATTEDNKNGRDILRSDLEKLPRKVIPSLKMIVANFIGSFAAYAIADTQQGAQKLNVFEIPQFAFEVNDFLVHGDSTS